MELAIPVVALASIFFVNKFVNNEKKVENFEDNTDLPDRNFPDSLPLDSNSSDITSQLSVGNRYANKSGAYTDKYFQPEGEKWNDLVKPVDATFPVANSPASNKRYESLLGKSVSSDYFQHNNMVPYFGGKLRTLHTDADINESILDSYNGTGTQIINKKEVSPLFAPHESLQYAYGAPNQSDFLQSRINPSKYMSNVKPFGEQKVGPGLGLGYTTEGAGGYNSGMAMREVWADRSVDELRVKTNPKASGLGLYGHEGPAISFVQERGDQGRQEKNRPETAFETGPERYLATTGAVKGNMNIPETMLKEVARPETTQEYQGVAKLANQSGSNHYVDGQYRAPRNIELGAVPIQPAVATGKYVATDGDYSYKSNTAYLNNRSLQTKNSGNYFGAVGGIITEAVAPLMDALRPTRKENSVGTLRPYQNAGSTVAQSYLFNPNDKTKTTLRELTEASPMHLAVDANQRGGAYETTPHQPVENSRYKTSDFFYAGNAESTLSKQVRPYDAEYNQRNNNKKSSTNVGYTTGGNTSMFHSDINMKTSGRRDAILKSQQTGAAALPNQTPSIGNMGQNTLNPTQYYSTIQADRNNGEVLSQLRDNPFAVPMIRGL